MLHLGDSLAEVDVRKQAVAPKGAKGLIYPVEGGPAPIRTTAAVTAYRDLMVRLGQRLELLGTGLQTRYLVEQHPDPCTG